MISKRCTVFRTTALLLLLTTYLGSAAPPTYNFLTNVVDHFDATAGEVKGVLFSVENNGSSMISLDVTLPVNPSGYFSIDTLNSTADIAPGQSSMFFVYFLSPEVGDFSALLSVTDGTLTDTLTVSATVLPALENFALHPALTAREVFTNQPEQIPVTVQNLTNANLTVQLSMLANPAFSLVGPSSITLPAYGSQTLIINFMATREGTYDGRLSATDGSATLETYFTMYAKIRKYAWIIDPKLYDEVALVGVAETHPLAVDNQGTTAATLQATLTGSSIFSLDPSDQSFTLQPGTGKDLHIGILGTAVGTYSTLLTVSDGGKTDSLVYTARIIENPTGFKLTALTAFGKNNQPVTVKVLAHNYSAVSTDVTLTLTGDSLFSYSGSNPVTLPPNTTQDILIDFAPARSGPYVCMLYATDGVLVDSARVIVMIRETQEYFALESGISSSLTLEAEPNTTITKQIQVENISGDTLSLQLGLFGNDARFTLSHNQISLGIDEKATFSISYTNDGIGGASDRLIINGRTQSAMLYLSGHEAYFNDIDGFRVAKRLSLMTMDTSEQDCEDLLLRNTTQGTIMVISAVLSGFSSSFSMGDQLFPITLRDGRMTDLSICYHPSIPGVKESEILTITFDNPASSPRIQSVNVFLSGESRQPNPRHVPGGVVALTAPIGGQSETTLTINNIYSEDITFENLTWKYIHPNGAFELVTPLPFTLPAADPSIPQMGSANIVLRYTPSDTASTVGTDDSGIFELQSVTSNPPWKCMVVMIGTPLPHSTPPTTLLLFPRDERQQEVNLGNVLMSETRRIEFMNNLQVPVTVSGFEIEGDRFEVANTGDFPLDLAPMGTVELELRCITATGGQASEDLNVHGSHESLSAGFVLLAKTGTSGVGNPSPTPEEISMSTSPNPSTDAVTVRLSEALTNVTVQIFDVIGQSVSHTTADRLTSWTWDGSRSGVPVQPGSYTIFVRGQDSTGRNVSIARKVLIVR